MDYLDTIETDFWTSDKKLSDIQIHLQSLNDNDEARTNMMVRMKGNHHVCPHLFPNVETASPPTPPTIAKIIDQLKTSRFVIPKGPNPFYNGLVEALLLIERVDWVKEHFTRGKGQVPKEFQSKPRVSHALEAGTHWTLVSDTMKYGTLMLRLSKEMDIDNLTEMREHLKSYYDDDGLASPFTKDQMKATPTMHMILFCLKQAAHIKPYNMPPIYDGLYKGIELIGNVEIAGEYFKEAEEVEPEIPPPQPASASNGAGLSNGAGRPNGNSGGAAAGASHEQSSQLSSGEKNLRHSDVLMFVADRFSDQNISTFRMTLSTRNYLSGQKRNSTDINDILMSMDSKILPDRTTFMSPGNYKTLYNVLYGCNLKKIADDLKEKAMELFPYSEW